MDSTNNFFVLDSFKANQILTCCFEKDVKANKKENGEVRLIVVNYSFACRTSEDCVNIQCISGHWRKGRFKRYWDCTQSYQGVNSFSSAQEIKSTYKLYDADYIVLDLQNGGEAIYNALVEEGFTVTEEEELYVIPNAKVQDLKSRCDNLDAIPCIIPIVGTADLNHNVWVELKRQLERGNCRFLIDERQKQALIEDSDKCYKFKVELDHILSPYLETSSMIFEAIALKCEWGNDRVKLVEPRHGNKSRIMTCAYGNYIMSQIEKLYK